MGTVRPSPLEEGGPAPARRGATRLKGAFDVDVSLIQPDPAQVRREFDADKLAELASSVAVRGIRQPIRVFQTGPDAYQIISGERRFRAAVAAGLSRIPCLIEDAPVASPVPRRRDILVDQIVENWQRADLNPYELSDALAELRDVHGLSQDEITRLTGKSKGEVSKYLAMQKVTADVQQKIRADDAHTFSRRHVLAVAQLDPLKQEELTAKIKTEKLSAEETEHQVKKLRSARSGVASRGPRVTSRKFVVGSATVQITIRKVSASTTELLHVVERVRVMLEAEGGAASGG